MRRPSSGCPSPRSRGCRDPEIIAAMRLRGSSMPSSSSMVSRRAPALVGAAEGDLRHGVLQHPGTDRMPFGVVGVEEALG